MQLKTHIQNEKICGKYQLTDVLLAYDGEQTEVLFIDLDKPDAYKNIPDAFHESYLNSGMNYAILSRPKKSKFETSIDRFMDSVLLFSEPITQNNEIMHYSVPLDQREHMKEYIANKTAGAKKSCASCILNFKDQYISSQVS